MRVQHRVQVLGTQRSGSNLLRLLLGGLPGVVAPPSVHKLREFQQTHRFYGDLNDERNLVTLVEDLGTLIRLNALEWPAETPTARQVIACSSGTAIADLVVAVYDALALNRRASVWVNKSLENVNYVQQIEKTGHDVMYVHLVRDPRDVALSFRRAPIGPKDPRAIALRWRSDQEQALRARRLIPAARWLEIRFEDLVQDPRQTMGVLCSRLSLVWSADALRFHSRAEAIRAASLSPMWGNLARPIDPGRIGGHSAPEHRDFVNRVEPLVADLMPAFGYRAAAETRPVLPATDLLTEIAASDAALRRRAAAANHDPNAWMHARQKAFLESLRTGRSIY